MANSMALALSIESVYSGYEFTHFLRNGHTKAPLELRALAGLSCFVSEKMYFISAFLETMLPRKGRTFAAEKTLMTMQYTTLSNG